MKAGRGPAATLPIAAVLLLSAAAASCASDPAPAPDPQQRTASAQALPSSPAAQDKKPSGVSDEIRALTEAGTPPSLLRALDLIRSRELGETEFGRAHTAVCVALLRKLYPEVSADLPPSDPPATHPYARILRDAEKGSYSPASEASDYLENVLPFLALLQETRPERLASSLPDLERAAGLRPASPIAPYFLGIVAERLGSPTQALAHYDAARSASIDCYPASIGAARVRNALGRFDEAASILSELQVRFPDNLQVKREIARALYARGEWERAAAAIAEILQRDPKDSRFVLMRAHALVETRAFTQAQPLLDAVASTESSNRLYLFLRARVQAEGYRNDESALAYLRSILRTDPADAEAAAYAARLLLDSSRPESVAEGRALLARLLSSAEPPNMAVELALKDAVARGAWAEAAPYAERMLAAGRSASALRSASLVLRGQGKAEEALALARELYEKPGASDDDALFYAGALLAAGKKAEAARVVDARLPAAAGGAAKSRFFFLRSRLRTDDEAVLSDLRSSLFEDPRNLEALVAMLEFYRSRKDDKRAVYYLKQALALAPDDPVLKRYQAEYAPVLGSAP